MIDTREKRLAALSKHLDPIGLGLFLPWPDFVDVDPGGSFSDRDASLVETPALFTNELLDELYTDSAAANVSSVWIDANSPQWSDLNVLVELEISVEADAIAVELFSQKPTTSKGYRVVRRAGTAVVVEGFGGVTVGAGNANTGTLLSPGVPYLLRVQIADEDFEDPPRTAIRVKVWPKTGAEPANWQAECYDESGSRLRSGTVALAANV